MYAEELTAVEYPAIIAIGIADGGRGHLPSPPTQKKSGKKLF